MKQLFFTIFLSFLSVAFVNASNYEFTISEENELYSYNRCASLFSVIANTARAQEADEMSEFYDIMTKSIWTKSADRYEELKNVNRKDAISWSEKNILRLQDNYLDYINELNEGDSFFSESMELDKEHCIGIFGKIEVEKYNSGEELLN